MEVITLRRKTREQIRHERAVVLQQLGTPTAAAIAADLAAVQAHNARLRAQATQQGVNTGPLRILYPVKDAHSTGLTHGGNPQPVGVPAPAEFSYPALVPGAAAVEGGGRHAPCLGLVTATVAGGNGSSEPCKYCGIVGGHNGNCPVIS